MKYKNLYIIVFLTLLIFVFTAHAQDNESAEINLNTQKKFSQVNSGQVNYIYSNKPTQFRSVKIQLRNGEIEPEPIKAYSVLGDIVSDDNVYYLIQFKNVESFREDYEKMSSAGIKFLEYIPDGTMITKIPQNVVRTKKYDSIRWIGILGKEQKIEPGLKKRLERYAEHKRPINITIEFYEPLDSDQFSRISKFASKILSHRDIYTHMTIEAYPENIDKIAELNFVAWMYSRGEIKLSLDTSSELTSADSVWDELNDASGVTVGIIDTGFFYNHTHFSSSSYSGNIYNATDWVDGDNRPEAKCPSLPDPCRGSHGVRTAGIIAGYGIFENRKIHGISPNASLVISRYLDENGNAVPPSVVDPAGNNLWEDILDPDDDGDFTEANSPDIISNSWNFNPEAVVGDLYTAESEKVDEVVRGALSNGKEIVVVFSAGNDEMRNGKVEPPGTAKNAITVGASGDYRSLNKTSQHPGACGSDNACTYDENNLYVMEYSSRSFVETLRVKPDILAPGSDITSSSIFKSITSQDSETYQSSTGTSFAAPHVSAVAAQILKNYPNATPALVKAFLITESVGGGTTDNKNVNKAWGRLNAYNSIYITPDKYLGQYDQNTVGNNLSGRPQEIFYSFTVPTDAKRLVVGMVYSDDPGPQLLNDLDLYLKTPSNSTLLPNGWNTFNDDTKNNVEKYVIDNPVSGTWEAHVKVILLNDSLGFINKTQNYAIKIVIYNQTEQPRIETNISANKTSLGIGETFTVKANVTVRGLSAYDVYAEMQAPGGITIVSEGIDGSGSEFDVLGDFSPGKTRQGKTWTLRPYRKGNHTIKLVIRGKYINDTDFVSTSEVNISVSSVYDTNVVKGWNDVSLPSIPHNTQIDVAFESAKGKYYNVWQLARQAPNSSLEWLFYEPNNPESNLLVYNETKGYWINMSSADTLQVGGSIPSTVIFNMSLGTNLIGYPSLTTKAANQSLSAVADNIESVFVYNASSDRWHVFTPDGIDNDDLESLGPGMGYYILLDNRSALWQFNGTHFTEHQPGLSASSNNSVQALASAYWGIAINNSEFVAENSSVTAEINGTRYANTTAASGLYGLVVPPDNPSTGQKEGGVAGEAVTIKVNGVVAGTVNWTEGYILNVNYSLNTAPPKPNVTYPNGGENVSNYVTVRWTKSVDGADFVRYYLEYTDQSQATQPNWYPTVSDYGRVTSFNDSSTAKDLDFNGTGSKTVYVRLPKNVQITSAKLEITGYGHGNGNWSAKANYPQNCWYPSAAEWNGSIYSFGGQCLTGGTTENLVYIYNLSNNSWTSAADMPFGAWGSCAVAYDDRIYVFGGRNNTNFVFNKTRIYYPSNNTWSSGADIPNKTHMPACTSSGNLIYVFGGSLDSSGNALDTTLVYNATSNTWTNGTKMPRTRYGAGIGKIGGLAYVFSGCFGSSSYRNQMDVYNITNNSWTTKSATKSFCEMASAVIDNRIFAFGGLQPSAPSPNNRTYEYSVESDAWIQRKDMAYQRYGIASVPVNGGAYVFPSGIAHSYINEKYSLSYPFKVDIDTGDDDVFDWSLPDELNFGNSPQTVNLNTQAIQDYLDFCNAGLDGNCTVPIAFYVNSTGILKIRNLNIYFDATEYLWNISGRTPGPNYKVRIKATDGLLNSSYDESDSSFIISPNAPLTVNSVSVSPGLQGFGENVTIQANVTDPNGQEDIYEVLAGITPPGETETNYTMQNITPQIWQYIYKDYTNGTYSLKVYAKDRNNSKDSKSGTFNLSVNLSIQLQTVKNIYGANETVTLTDPPEPEVMPEAEGEATKSYDESTKTATFYKAGSKIAGLQLISNTDNCLAECETLIRIRPSTAIKLPASESADYRWNFVKANANQPDLVGYSFEIQRTVPYEVADYTETCSPYTIEANETNITENNCTLTETGKHTEYATVFEPFAFWNETLEANKDYYIKLKGRKLAAIGENNVEWMPTFYSLPIDEWAPWNSNYSYATRINIENRVHNNLTMFQVNISINNTLFAGKALPNLSDVRFIDETNSTELNATLVEGNSTNGAKFWVEMPLLSGIDSGKLNTTIFMYYGYANAARTYNENNTYVFFDNFTYHNGLDTSKWTKTFDSAQCRNYTTADNELKLNFSATGSDAGCAVVSKTDVNATETNITIRMDVGMFVVNEDKVANGPAGAEIGFTDNATSFTNYFMTRFANKPSPDNEDTINRTGKRFEWAYDDDDGKLIFAVMNVSSTGSLYGSKNRSDVQKQNSATASVANFSKAYPYLRLTRRTGSTIPDVEYDYIVVRKEVVNHYEKHPKIFLLATESVGKNQSKIVNKGTTNASVYLLMKVQYYNATSQQWSDVSTVVDDTSPRRITTGQTQALDTIWNPVGWNTSSSAAGTYRAFVAATDEVNTILKNLDGTNLTAAYNFTIA